MDINVTLKVEMDDKVINLVAKLAQVFGVANKVTIVEDSKPSATVAKPVKEVKQEAIPTTTTAKPATKGEPDRSFLTDEEPKFKNFTREDLMKAIGQARDRGCSAVDVKQVLTNHGFQKTAEITKGEDFDAVILDIDGLGR